MAYHCHSAQSDPAPNGITPSVHAELEKLRPLEAEFRRKWLEDESGWHKLPPRAWPPTQPKHDELDELKGWRHTAVGTDPPRRMSNAVLDPLPGHEDAYLVRMTWGEPVELPIDTDGGTVERDMVSVTYLSRITATQRSDLEVAEKALSGLLGAP